MRLWPFSRPAATAETDDDPPIKEDQLRHNVEDLMLVRERQHRGGAVRFGGELLVPPDRALGLMVDRFRPLGYTPFLHADNGRVWMTAAPLREGRAPSGIVANVLLFALTCASTVFAGAFWAGALSAELPRLLAAALPFAITLLAILLAHEFGHYFMARHYGAAVSLPYFIPAPPLLVGSAFVPLFGTLGAIIQMRSIPRDRNSLFDIAAAGPIAGLLVAIPTFVYGLYSATLVRLVPGGIQLGDPLLLQALFYLKFGPIPPNMDVQLPPMALAGWFAFVVTALNLFPVGQLDGGRISYALFGRRHRLVGTGVLLGSVALGVATQSWNWVLWAVVVFFLIGVDHTPPLDDMTPLSRGRRVLGVTCLLLLFLLIPPVPIRLV